MADNMGSEGRRVMGALGAAAFIPFAHVDMDCHDRVRIDRNENMAAAARMQCVDTPQWIKTGRLTFKSDPSCRSYADQDAAIMARDEKDCHWVYDPRKEKPAIRTAMPLSGSFSLPVAQDNTRR